MNVMSIPVFRPGPFAVDQYHQMVERGFLSDDAPVELVEGWIVPKMPNSPPHAATVQLIAELLASLIGPDWCVRVQLPVTTPDSEPEPDVCVARGRQRDYVNRHPNGGDVGLVVEVAYSSLGFDRNTKSRVYSRAGIPTYWLVDLDEGSLEVFHDPDSDAINPRYRGNQKLQSVDSVVLTLDGSIKANINVSELLP